MLLFTGNNRGNKLCTLVWPTCQDFRRKWCSFILSIARTFATFEIMHSNDLVQWKKMLCNYKHSYSCIFWEETERPYFRCRFEKISYKLWIFRDLWQIDTSVSVMNCVHFVCILQIDTSVSVMNCVHFDCILLLHAKQLTLMKLYEWSCEHYM